MDQRGQGWLCEEFHDHFRWVMLHGCARYDLACPLYCLMPDHAHFMMVGWTPQADQKRFINYLRKHTQQWLKKVDMCWQKQAHDHVLRPLESDRYAFESLAHYIAENPVRAGLVRERFQWPYTGSVIPGYPELMPAMADYWSRYWRLMAYRNRHPGAVL
jgi:putative transposase